MQFCWDDPGLAGKLLSCLPQSQLFPTKACFRRKLLGRTIRKQKQHPHNPRAQRDKMRLRKEALTSQLVFGLELVFEIRARNPQTTPKGKVDDVEPQLPSAQHAIWSAGADLCFRTNFFGGGFRPDL